jgi:hypothetical protein
VYDQLPLFPEVVCVCVLQRIIICISLQVLYTSLFPAVNWDSPSTLQLLKMFFVSGGAGAVVEMLTKNNFMPLADVATKRSAYLSVLKLTKTVLTVTAHLLLRAEAEVSRIGAERLRMVSDAMVVVPNPVNDSVLRRLAETVSVNLLQHVIWTFFVYILCRSRKR